MLINRSPDDMTLSGTYVLGVEDTYTVEIYNTGGVADEYIWYNTTTQTRSQAVSSAIEEGHGVYMTGGTELIGDSGYEIVWGATTGHYTGDMWFWTIIDKRILNVADSDSGQSLFSVNTQGKLLGKGIDDNIHFLIDPVNNAYFFGDKNLDKGLVCYTGISLIGYCLGNQNGNFMNISDATSVTNFNGKVWDYSAVVFTGTGLDDGSIVSIAFRSDVEVTYSLTITVEDTIDKFDWSDSLGNSGSGVDVTFGVLLDGVAFGWAAVTGHTAGDNWTFTISPISTPYLQSVGATRVTSIGDVGAAGNGTSIVIDDMNNKITAYGLNSYDDDTAAGGAGLTTGDLYQTSGNGTHPLDVAGIVMIKQ